MKCPHCAVEIHAEAIWVPLEEDSEGQWGIEKYLCPNPDCKKMIFYLVMGSYKVNSRGSLIGFDEIQKRFLVNPKGSNRPPVPPQVPQKLAEDYVEACIVLPDSPKRLSHNNHSHNGKKNTPPTNKTKDPKYDELLKKYK